MHAIILHTGNNYTTLLSNNAVTNITLLLPCTLPVGDIQPYHFEPERETPSKAEETLDLDGHFGEERLGNTTWYV